MVCLYSSFSFILLYFRRHLIIKDSARIDDCTERLGWWQKAHPSNPPSISNFFLFSGFLLGGWWHRNARALGGTPWRCELLHGLVCPSQGSMTNEISSSESLDYHIIIPAGDGLSISDILQSITYISIFFFYPKRVSIVDSLFRFFFFFCLGLSNINMEYYTHEQKK